MPILPRRTLILYNLAIALILALIGLLSIYARDAVQPARFADIPMFAEAARTALTEEQNPDQLRERALHYFTIARDLKRARFEDADRLYYDVRVLAFFVSGLFVLGALLLLLVPQAKTENPAS